MYSLSLQALLCYRHSLLVKQPSFKIDFIPLAALPYIPFTTLDLWQQSSTVVRQMLMVITVESLMHGM